MSENQNNSDKLIPLEPGLDLLDILSTGTYTVFPYALKEFVSNAYDADATRVDILFSNNFNDVSVSDNGLGMSEEGFKTKFSSIARVSGNNHLTNLGRKRIGRFGIGTLSLINRADTLEIQTKEKNTDKILKASINLVKIRKLFKTNKNLSDFWIFDKEWIDTTQINNSFTKIIIKGLHPEIRDDLTTGQRDDSNFIQSISNLSGLENLRWTLGLACAVKYRKNGPFNYINQYTDIVLSEKIAELEDIKFRVFINNVEVLNELVFPKFKLSKNIKDYKRKLLFARDIGFSYRNIISKKDSKIEYKGYIYFQNSKLYPEEIRGVLIRIRGVAIGSYNTMELRNVPKSTLRDSFTGEIWVEKGLDEALQMNRETFNKDHPSYREFHSQIKSIIEEESKQAEKRSRVINRLIIEAKKGNFEERKNLYEEGTLLSGKQKNEKVDSDNEKSSSSEFLPSGLFREQSKKIKRVMLQINGCFQYGYYDACAIMIRRLIELIIIEIFTTNNKRHEIMDKGTYDILKLKVLINKLSDGGHFKIGKRNKEYLLTLKDIGDIAAHDEDIEILRQDLIDNKVKLKSVCSKLIKMINV